MSDPSSLVKTKVATTSTAVGSAVHIAAAPLRSAFADDEEMAELVAFFVEQMPERVAALRSAMNDRDAAQIARLAHQLKGSGSGYGFDPITQVAAQAEKSAKTSKDLEQIVRDTRELIALCERVSV